MTTATHASWAALSAQDQAARLRALTELDATLLVEAGAGSGKTSVLAGRIVMLLASGRPPASIAAITFTEAAASELRQRVEEFVTGVLQRRDTGPVAACLAGRTAAAQHQALAAADAELDTLTCTTIHWLLPPAADALPGRGPN